MNHPNAIDNVNNKAHTKSSNPNNVIPPTAVTAARQHQQYVGNTPTDTSVITNPTLTISTPTGTPTSFETPNTINVTAVPQSVLAASIPITISPLTAVTPVASALPPTATNATTVTTDPTSITTPIAPSSTTPTAPLSSPDNDASATTAYPAAAAPAASAARVTVHGDDPMDTMVNRFVSTQVGHDPMDLKTPNTTTNTTTIGAMKANTPTITTVAPTPVRNATSTGNSDPVQAAAEEVAAAAASSILEALPGSPGSTTSDPATDQPPLNMTAAYADVALQTDVKMQETPDTGKRTRSARRSSVETVTPSVHATVPTTRIPAPYATPRTPPSVTTPTAIATPRSIASPTAMTTPGFIATHMGMATPGSDATPLAIATPTSAATPVSATTPASVYTPVSVATPGSVVTPKVEDEEKDIMDMDSDEADERVLRPKAKKRARQHTNLISERFVATKWMIDHSAIHGETNIKSKAVRRFPRIFTGSEKAALQKASRWWKSRHSTLALRDPDVRTGSVTAHMRGGAIRSPLKALPGRGRRRAKWVSSLHKALLKEYERLHVTGLKVSSSVLQAVAKELVAKAPSQSEFGIETKAQDGVPIVNKINARWVDQFMHAHEIILRWPGIRTRRINPGTAGSGGVTSNMTGGGRRGPLEKHVAYHLGQLKRGFDDGTFDDDMMESAGDVRFVMNLPSGRSLGLEEGELRDEDISALSSHTSGTHVDNINPSTADSSAAGSSSTLPPLPGSDEKDGEQVSVLLRMRAGIHGKIEVPLVVFSDIYRTYPLEGVVDSVAGACYRTSPEASVDGSILLQWLRDSRTMSRSEDGRKKHLFMDDSCERIVNNAEIQVCLQSLNIELHKMPRNVTDLLQPGRTVIVPEFRILWKRHWELYVAECKSKGLLIKDEITGAERAPMPEKRFYLEVAASVVEQLNTVQLGGGDDDMSYNGVCVARRAMMKTGLSKGVNGLWEVSQLSDELKEIIAKYQNHFDGEPVQDGLTTSNSADRKARRPSTSVSATDDVIASGTDVVTNTVTTDIVNNVNSTETGDLPIAAGNSPSLLAGAGARKMNSRRINVPSVSVCARASVSAGPNLIINSTTSESNIENGISVAATAAATNAPTGSDIGIVAGVDTDSTSAPAAMTVPPVPHISGVGEALTTTDCIVPVSMATKTGNVHVAANVAAVDSMRMATAGDSGCKVEGVAMEISEDDDGDGVGDTMMMDVTGVTTTTNENGDDFNGMSDSSPVAAAATGAAVATVSIINTVPDVPVTTTTNGTDNADNIKTDNVTNTTNSMATPAVFVSENILSTSSNTPVMAINKTVVTTNNATETPTMNGMVMGAMGNGSSTGATTSEKKTDAPVATAQ